MAIPFLSDISGKNATFAGSVTVGTKLMITSSSDYIDVISDDLYIVAADKNILYSGNAETLRLDESQDATFAGNVSLGDAKELIFGAATDFKIYHNNTTNVNHVSSQLDRQLSINGNIINLTNQANSTTYLKLESTGATFAGDVHIGSGSPNGVLDIHASNGNWRINDYGGMYFRNSSNATHESYIHPRSDGSLSIGRVAESNWSGSTTGTYAAATYDHLIFDTSSNATFAGTVSVPTGKSFRLYNAAGSGWGEITLNETDNKIQFNRGITPSGNEQADQTLGLATKRWHTVYAHDGDFSGDATFAGSISAPSSFNFTGNNGYIKVGSSWNTGTLNFLNGSTTYLIFDVPNGRIQNNLGSYLTASSGTAKFGSFDNQSMSLVTNNTARLTIDTSGNADFSGNVTSAGIIKSNTAEARFQLTSTHGRETVLNQGGGNFHIQPDHGSGVGISYGNTSHPGLLKLYNNTTAKITLDASGGDATFAGKITASGDPGVVVTSSGNSTIHVASTGTGLAGMYMDASNGDFIGSDYVFVGQDNDKTFRLESFNSSGDILLKESNINTLRLSGGDATFGGSISMSDSILINYTGSDGQGIDAGVKVMNDNSDWGMYVRKHSNSDYGIRIDSGGTNAFAIYSTTGGSGKTFGVHGGTGNTTIAGTLNTVGLQVTSDNNFYRDTINSNTGGESWNASNGWHRIIEITGGTGRGKCHFLIQTGGGSGTPCRVEAIVNTAWSNANSTLSILHSSYPNFITDIRVVRNTTTGKAFVDIKGGSEDYVEVTILPSSTNAAVVNFTNVNTLPTGDSKQIEKTITGKIMSLAAGTGSDTSGWRPFQVGYDGSISSSVITAYSPAGNAYAANFLPSTGSGFAKFYQDSNNHMSLYMANSSGTANVVLNSSGVSYIKGGNLIVGGSADSGEKLQVEGTGYFAGTLNIGTSSPSVNTNYGSGDLNIENDTYAAAQIMSHNSTAGNFSFLGIGKSSGTGASPTIVQAEETVGLVGFYGYDGSNYKRIAQIGADVDGTPSAGVMPGRLEFFTNSSSNNANPTKRLTIGADGLSTFTGDVVSPGIYVGSRNASFDFYNNGTSYLNGAVTVDASFTQSGGAGSTFSGSLEVQNNQLKVRNTTSNHQLTLQSTVGGNARIMAHKTNIAENQNLDIKSTQIDLYSGSISDSANISTLLLDSSNNATFAGDVTLGDNKKLHGGRVHPRSIYGTTPANGFLIATDVAVNQYAMIQGEIDLIQFNSSTKQRIEFSATLNNNGTVFNSKGTADINITIKLFVYNSKWYVHIPQASTYMTCTAYISKANAYVGDSDASSSIVTLTAAAVPSSGVTGSTDIVCKFAQSDASFAGDITQSDGKRIWFRNSSASSATGAQSYIHSDGLNLKIKGDDNVRILGDGGGTIAHFDYTGKVGIGIESSLAGLLHVKGSGDAIRVESTNTGAGGAQMDLLHFTTSPADEDTHAVINMGGYYTGSTSVYGTQIKSIWTDVSERHSRLEFTTCDTTVGTALTLAHDKSATFAGDVTLDPTVNTDVKLKLHTNSGALGDAYSWNVVSRSSAANYNFEIQQGTTTVMSIGNTAAVTGHPVAFAGNLKTTGNLQVINAAAEIWIGDSLAGTDGGFIKWNSTSDYLYIGNSYNSAFNEDIKIDNTGKVTFGGNVQIDGTLSGVGAFVPVGGGTFSGAVTVDDTFTVKNHDTTSSVATQFMNGKRTNGTSGAFGELIFSNNNDSVATVAGFRDGADNKGSLVFQTQNGTSGFGTWLTIKADGKIGVGTQEPAAHLQVERAIGATFALSASSVANSGNRGDISWYNSDVSTVANIRAAADTDNVGTKIQFFTRPVAGALTNSLTINASGSVSFTEPLYIPDGKKINLGSGQDLQLYHSGSVGYIVNREGSFNIEQGKQDGNLVFQADNGEDNSTTADYFYLDGGSAVHDGTSTTEMYTIWKDKSRIAVGNGKDLQLYHDGSNSYIRSSTGWLNMPTSGSGISMANSDFSKSIARFLVDGANELYYNGTKRFETTDNGINVIGGITSTAANTNVFSHGTAWGTNLKLTNTNADVSPPILTFLKNGGSPANNDYVGFTNYRMDNSNGDEFSWVELSALATGVTDGSESSAYRIGTWGAGTELPATIYASSVATGPRVGIGTASPDKSLTVYAPTYAGIDIKNAHSKLWEAEQYFADEGYQGIYYQDAKKIQFRANGDSYFNSGKLGIGTASPGAQLHNYSTATTNVFITGEGTAAQNNWGAQNCMFVKTDNGLLISKANVANNTNRIFNFYNDSSGNAQMYMHASTATAKIKFNTTGTSYFNGGGLLIGTTTDKKKLTVYGGNDNGIWVDSQGGQYTSVAWGHNGTEKANVAWDNTNTNFALTAYGSGSSMTMAAGGSVRLTINSDGSIYAPGLIESGGSLAAGDGVAGAPGFKFRSDPHTGMYRIGNDTIGMTTGGSLALTIGPNGNCTAAGDVVAYSDERLKTNIKTLDGSKVYEMRGVSFTKDDKEGSGVIAQELEKIAPELVNSDSEYKAVAYGNITGYLIEAIKDLKAEIEELKSNKCNCNK